MTIEQCYQRLQGSYGQVMQRLPSEALVERFLLKFLDDGSYRELLEAVNVGDAHGAFRAAHTLKGVSANMSFDSLRDSASAMVELLRGIDGPVPAAAAERMEKISRDYALAVDSIRLYQEEKN